MSFAHQYHGAKAYYCQTGANFGAFCSVGSANIVIGALSLSLPSQAILLLLGNVKFGDNI